MDKQDALDLLFDELLTATTKAFENGSLGGHETTTFSGIKTRFEKVDNRKELIMRVCRELEDYLEEYFQEREIIPYYLGLGDVRINFAKSEEEYENGADTDDDIIGCDIWEQVSSSKYGATKGASS
jgi:hypothetical protein